MLLILAMDWNLKSLKCIFYNFQKGNMLILSHEIKQGNSGKQMEIDVY